MISMHPMLIDVTQALSPVMLAVALAMTGCAVKLVYEALRCGFAGTRAGRRQRTARVAA
jgi:hypothetical protein